jgi:3-isopropylmalate/(R)-2-methylmalate dehydratase large subunit
MGMTIIEKILARQSGQDRVRPGELVTVNVDTVVMFDNNFMDSVWREILHVIDPDRVIVAFDHRAPAAHVESATAHQTGRRFVEKFGIKRFHDVGRMQGIAHVLVADHGYAMPGTVLLCSDSHTCSAGAFNCIARGVGAPDITYALTKGETWFRVGETVRYDLEGSFNPAVSMKDVFLHIAGTYGGHETMNVEFGGSALPQLNMNARRTLTTMGAELSAEFATFEPDQILFDHIDAHNPDHPAYEAQYPDEDATYADRRTIRLDEIEPLVALPDSVLDNSRPVGDLSGTIINQAFIGSCANGTIDDLECAAKVLAGRQVADSVRLIVTPGSQTIYRQAAKSGVLSTLVEAGAVVTNATCGACGGGHLGVLAAGETCITASTRNFKGRMGDPSAKIYMGSPATVAASAIKGTIADPSEFLGKGG